MENGTGTASAADTKEAVINRKDNQNHMKTHVFSRSVLDQCVLGAISVGSVLD